MVKFSDLKTAPNSSEAEKGVISCVLIDNDSFNKLEELDITHKNFYNKTYSTIYKSIERLKNKKKTIDAVSLSNDLDSQNKLEDIGGLDTLQDLSVFSMTSSMVWEYWEIVKEKSILRDIDKISKSTTNSVYDGKEPDEIISNTLNSLKDLQSGSEKDSCQARDIVGDRFEKYVEMAESDEDDEIDGIIKTGFIDDYMSGGLRPGDFIIIAARPAVWKTSYAINMGMNMAKRYRVGMISLEMKADILVDRMVSTVSKVSMSDISRGNLTAVDLDKIAQAGDVITELDFNIKQSSSAYLSDVRKFLNANDIEVLIVDYLQLMSARDTNSKPEEVWKISRWLKNLAMEFNIPIIALSQLSRKVENRPDKHPKLSDLNWSGSIEQDANAVLMMHKEELYDPDTDRKGEIDLFIRKNRNWPVWCKVFTFEKEIMRFNDENGVELF